MNKLQSGVYEIVNSVTGKRYVGSAVKLLTRFCVHRKMLRDGKHHNGHLQSSWNKHGESSFSFNTLLFCSPSNTLYYEQRAMDVLDPEYNIARTAGSCLGVKHSDEAKAKRSALNIGNKFNLGKKASPDTIAKMSATRKGRDLGKKRSPEAVAKVAAAHRGMKRSDETRAKIAAKAIGRPWSDEAKAKLSATLTGRKMSELAVQKLIGNQRAKGLKHTDEWKAANSIRQLGMKRPKSPEYRAKIAAGLRGRKATPEHRANQAAAQRGTKRGPYKPWSPETRARVAALRSKHKQMIGVPLI